MISYVLIGTSFAFSFSRCAPAKPELDTHLSTSSVVSTTTISTEHLLPTIQHGTTMVVSSELLSTDSDESSAASVDKLDVASFLGCDIFAQNCPDGQKCAPFGLNDETFFVDTHCVPIVSDPKSLGDSCSTLGNVYDGVDTCAKGLICWDLTSEVGDSGICRAHCSGSIDSPECPPGEAGCPADSPCSIFAGGALTLCLTHCNPVSQNCENPLRKCIPDEVNHESFKCVNASDGGLLFGGVCTVSSDCAKGLFCSLPDVASECDQDASGCCVPFCDLNNVQVCPGEGQECVPWFDTPSPECSRVGFCSL